MVDLGQFGETLEEAVRRALTDVEVDGFQDGALHAEDLRRRVLLARDVDEVLEGRRVDFLILGDHEQGSEADELDVAPMHNLMLAKVAIDHVDGEEQSLRPQFEIVMDLNQPVHESRPN